MKKEKPAYSILQNIRWMISIAWRVRKRVLLFMCLSAALEIGLSLTQLYVAPVILSEVEQKVSISQLLTTIGIFTFLLFVIEGLKAYIEENTMFARVDVRSKIIGMVSQKTVMTSYPNTMKSEFIQLRDKTYSALDNNRSATEHIWETMTMLLKNAGGFLIYLGILSRLNFFLMGIVIVTCLAGFMVSKYTMDWNYRNRKIEEKYYQNKNYLITEVESLKFAKDIRIFGLQNWLDEIVKKMHDLYLDYNLKCERVALLADLTEALLTMARNGIAYVYLIQTALTKNLSVSQFLLYFTAISTFTALIMGILNEFTTLRKENMDLSITREFINYPEVFQFEEGSDVPVHDTYEIQLDHVSYHYPETDTEIIHDMNLTIHPNEKLAIVGLNGAGKTTLIKLMCGLLDPTDGCVLLNGMDIRKFNRRKYYDLFSAVFQDFSVLDVTVAENIAQSEENIDLDKVHACVEKAGLSEKVKELPMGLDTHVGRDVYLDGVLFSGGETQRLMLARALYKDGPILLLDEPTAALDPIAENDMYMKYNEMAKGKTSVFISHRLASTRFCDRIIFLENGKITEEGTHESLLKADGAYARLFEVQSRYYQEGKEF